MVVSHNYTINARWLNEFRLGYSLENPQQNFGFDGRGKAFALGERARIRLSGSFTNLPNHVNLDDPNLTITSSSFGRITRARASDFGGNRTGEVSARVEF